MPVAFLLDENLRGRLFNAIERHNREGLRVWMSSASVNPTTCRCRPASGDLVVVRTRGSHFDLGRLQHAAGPSRESFGCGTSFARSVSGSPRYQSGHVGRASGSGRACERRLRVARSHRVRSVADQVAHSSETFSFPRSSGTRYSFWSRASSAWRSFTRPAFAGSAKMLCSSFGSF